MEKNEICNRDMRLDTIWAIAITFVIAIHAFSWIGFYEEPITGEIYLVLSICRVAFTTCVPLFLLLSGYLRGGYKGDLKRYYFKIIRVLLTYFFAGIVCQSFRYVIDYNDVKMKEIVLSFFSFTASPYGWYIAMYLGLFLMMPFVCMLYDGLEKRQRIVFLTSLIIIVVTPSIFNNFNFNNEHWWNTVLGEQSLLVPEYWMCIYPIMYFCIGLWIRDMNIEKLNLKLLIILLVLFCCLFGTINYIKNWNTIFPWNNDTAYGGYQNLIVSFLIFLICLSLKINLKSIGSNFIIWISKNSLGSYLVSYIADRIVYKIEMKYCSTLFIRVILLPISISAVLFISTAISAIIGFIVGRCERSVSMRAFYYN